MCWRRYMRQKGREAEAKREKKEVDKLRKKLGKELLQGAIDTKGGDTGTKRKIFGIGALTGS